MACFNALRKAGRSKSLQRCEGSQGSGFEGIFGSGFAGSVFGLGFEGSVFGDDGSVMERSQTFLLCPNRGSQIAA